MSTWTPNQVNWNCQTPPAESALQVYPCPIQRWHSRAILLLSKCKHNLSCLELSKSHVTLRKGRVWVTNPTLHQGWWGLVVQLVPQSLGFASFGTGARWACVSWSSCSKYALQNKSKRLVPSGALKTTVFSRQFPEAGFWCSKNFLAPEGDF